MCIRDSPLGTPSCVKEAIASAISEGDLSFLPNSDGQHLSRVIGRYFEMPPECIMAGTSVSSMIGAIAQAYRPCSVGIPTPAPTGYFLSVANVGHNPVKLVNPFSLSAIEPQVAFSNGCQFDAAVLANPSFPCARLLSEKILKRYLEVCNWVIVDESNISLTLGGESFVELTQQYRCLLYTSERGIALLRFLKESLNTAQQKVEVLMGELEMPEDDTVIDSTLSKA